MVAKNHKKNPEPATFGPSGLTAENGILPGRLPVGFGFTVLRRPVEPEV